MKKITHHQRRIEKLLIYSQRSSTKDSMPISHWLK